MRARTCLALLAPLSLVALACSAGVKNNPTGGGGGGSAGNGMNGGGGIGGAVMCDICADGSYVPCNADGTPGPKQPCPAECAPGKGCVECIPGAKACVGNEVHE